MQLDFMFVINYGWIDRFYFSLGDSDNNYDITDINFFRLYIPFFNYIYFRACVCSNHDFSNHLMKNYI
jgi:hypothetical protein